MLSVIDHSNRAHEHQLLRAMFEARKRVFIDLLKWDLPVLADRFEIDHFDDPHATYLIVGDQEPYSGVLLNATMNRHCEPFGRPYVGIELRQDIAGRASWQPGLSRMLVEIARQAVREVA